MSNTQKTNGPARGATGVDESQASGARIEQKGAPAMPGPTPTGEAAKPASKGSGATSGQPSRSGLRTLPETFLDERDDVLAVINELEDQLDRYEEIREALERELTDATGQLQSTRQKAQELEWQVVTLQTRLEAGEQTRQEITLLEEEISETRTRSQRMADQLGAVEKDHARIATELRTANKQLEEFWATRKERDGLRADIKTIKVRLEQALRDGKELEETRNILQAKLTETQAALEETRTAKHQAELSIRATSTENEEIRRGNAALEEKVETLKGEKKTLEAHVTRLERENARLVDQQKFYECELTSLRSMNRSAESTLSNVKKAFAEVRVALAETKTRARRRTLESWPRVQSSIESGVASRTATEPSPTIVHEAPADESPVLTEETRV